MTDPTLVALMSRLADELKSEPDRPTMLRLEALLALGHLSQAIEAHEAQDPRLLRANLYAAYSSLKTALTIG